MKSIKQKINSILHKLDFISLKTIKNVIVLSGSTAIVQIVLFAFVPFITRLYSPQEYGIQGLFLAVIAVLAPVVSLGFPLAVVLPEKNSEARMLVHLGLLFTMVFVIAMTMMLYFTSDSLATLFKLEPLLPYRWLLLPAIFFTATKQAYEQLCIRKLQYKKIAQFSILETLLSQTAKLGAGLLHPFAATLISINVSVSAGSAAAFRHISRDKTSEHNNPDHKSINYFRNLYQVAKRYKNFALYRTPEVLLNALSQNLPIVLIASFAGPESTGLYVLARATLGVPALLFGKSVANVFFPALGHAVRNKQPVYQKVKKSIIAMAILGIIPYGIVFLCGPCLYGKVFGADWQQSGEYARWMSVWLYATFISIPAVKTITVFELLKFQFWLTLSAILCSLLAILYGFKVTGNTITTIQLFSVTTAMFSIFLIHVVLHTCKKYDNTLQE